jgi:hypothetical protein
MKTALELLGDKCDGDCDRPTEDENSRPYCVADLELVAQRAREEMREMAALAVEEKLGVNWDDAEETAAGIRALPVSP